MVKEKGSGGKTKKNVIKSHWDEDDTSITQNVVLAGKKKNTANKMKTIEVTAKAMDDGRIKKKMEARC